MALTNQTLFEALKLRYLKGEVIPGNVSYDDLSAFLRTAIEVTRLEDDLATMVQAAKPDWELSDIQLAVLRSAQDCRRLIFRLVDLEPRVDEILHRATPDLVCQLLHRPTLPLDKTRHSVLEILDLLVSASVGWSSDLGRAGERLIAMLEDSVSHLNKGDVDYRRLSEALTEGLAKEQSRIAKLEERLIASETGLLRSQKAKQAAAAMINKAMRNRKMTENAISFLQGAWYESVQLLGLRHGFESEEWFRATKLTETLIWTFQPIQGDDETANRERQRLYRIIEHLPGELRDLLVALDGERMDDALAGIADEHVSIVTGEPLDYRRFKPIVTETGDTGATTPSVSRILLRKVSALTTGQWFTFSDGDVTVRIKLILKLDDMRQLLFTNRNGMKAMGKSYDEFAYYLSSGVVKPLNHEDVFRSTFRTYYQSLVDEYERKQRQATEDLVREAEAEKQREAAAKKAQQEAARLKRAAEEEEQARRERIREETLARAREIAESDTHRARIPKVTRKVTSLNIGSRISLPGADGALEDCKLAVKLATADKLVFVNTDGVKVGEYTTEQLVQLVVSGVAEIEEESVEFEDTLAQVVSKLRQDRNKSYDDLTGT